MIGRALSAPARAAMLDLLMDGSSRPARELAGFAGVGAPSASEHLSVLLDAGLLSCRVRGRQKYYRIADDEVAGALEQLGRLCPPAPERTWQREREARDLADARLCYDHLAGRPGVALADAFLHDGWLDDELRVTAAGDTGLTGYGIDLAALRSRRRPVSLACPDWTERRSHIGGGLGAALARYWLDQGWVRRRETGRGLDLAPAGRLHLERLAGRS